MEGAAAAPHGSGCCKAGQGQLTRFGVYTSFSPTSFQLKSEINGAFLCKRRPLYPVLHVVSLPGIVACCIHVVRAQPHM